MNNKLIGIGVIALGIVGLVVIIGIVGSTMGILNFGGKSNVAVVEAGTPFDLIDPKTFNNIRVEVLKNEMYLRPPSALGNQGTASSILQITIKAVMLTGSENISFPSETISIVAQKKEDGIINSYNGSLIRQLDNLPFETVDSVLLAPGQERFISLFFEIPSNSEKFELVFTSVIDKKGSSISTAIPLDIKDLKHGINLVYK